MQIDELALVQLAREGRLTLQVPDIIIGQPSPSAKMIDCEEDDFERLSVSRYSKKNGISYLPNPRGYLFFSRKGFEKFKPLLETAFSTKRGNTWQDFLDHAEQHFKQVVWALDHEIELAKKRVAKFEAMKRARQ